jgi:hypothetical protein
MPATPCRKFSLLDAMILVAGMALGFAFIGNPGPELRNFTWRSPLDGLRAFDDVNAEGMILRGVHRLLWLVTSWLTPGLIPWAFATILLRLRRPRPSLRRLVRQPGFAACLAVALLSLVDVGGHLFAMVEYQNWSVPGTAVRSLIEYVLKFFPVTVHNFVEAPHLGAAVAGVWGILALGKMCRCEPSWIDRLGRAQGVFWVLALLLAASMI